MFFQAHSGIRYLTLLAGLWVIGHAGWALIKKRPYDRGMLRISGIYAGLLDLQILTGLAVVMANRIVMPMLIGHIFMGVFAAVVAHIPGSVMKRREPEERSYPPHIVAAAVSLVLVALTVMALARPVLGRLGPF